MASKLSKISIEIETSAPIGDYSPKTHLEDLRVDIARGNLDIEVKHIRVEDADPRTTYFRSTFTGKKDTLIQYAKDYHCMEWDDEVEKQMLLASTILSESDLAELDKKYPLEPHILSYSSIYHLHTESADGVCDHGKVSTGETINIEGKTYQVQLKLVEVE